MVNKVVKRGQLWIADLRGNNGSEQGGIRPVLIIQNDIGNYHSPTTIVAPLTTKITKASLPTHVIVDNLNKTGLSAKSVILMEQLRTIDKDKLFNQIGEVNDSVLTKVNLSLIISLAVQAA